ncbi:MAG: GNAT family N-acetyltransferase [Bacteroidales bacterium]|nr:GNAT family N-acetyltransferase [Bacteroidales bacterium]
MKRATDGYTVVAVENEKIVGTGNITGNEINAVYVDPRYQQSGIGKMIVNALLNKAKENNHPKVVLDATLNAKKFYDSLGFITLEKLTQVVKNANLDYYKMEKGF